jgi:hypothetical protein
MTFKRQNSKKQPQMVLSFHKGPWKWVMLSGQWVSGSPVCLYTPKSMNTTAT